MNGAQLRDTLAHWAACEGGLAPKGALREVAGREGAWELGVCSRAPRLAALRAGASEAVFDLESGKLVRTGKASGAGKPFRSSAFPTPLREALGQFAALAPVRAMRVGPGGWSLRLEPGLFWPDFLRLDVSRGFAPRASLLSLLLLDRELRELRVEGEALWAYCA